MILPKAQVSYLRLQKRALFPGPFTVYDEIDFKLFGHFLRHILGRFE